ncbi:hypothetical protein ACJIZ3_013099 [Penstemon smallii]|uniref:Uncharacterized protein n=1 Tax=Penstemon smallii TaxID=265156 RepID=A0ABD3UQ07_9LAMI
MMNQVNQGVLPVKRRRGRPRKDHSLKHTDATNAPPGFKEAKEYPSSRDDSTAGTDYMVGQAVTGVVEATFDAGFLLTVKIGNSNTNLRGVVFKPGHCVPVTAANDVVPHVQMIRRNDVHLPRAKKLAIKRASVGAAKQKYTPPRIAPSVPLVGVRGTVVPVVLQPVGFPNGFPSSKPTHRVLSFVDEDVHMVEPISMLPVGQISASHLAAQGSELNNDNGLFNESNGQGDKAKLMMSTDIDIPGSSQTSDKRIENCKEALRSSAVDIGIVSNTFEALSTDDSLQTASVTKPFFNFGTGKMTELLQAVQVNMRENQVQFAE